MVPNSFALAGNEEQSTRIFRNEVGPCDCIGASELRFGLCLSRHLSLRSYQSWEACEPDSEGCFPLCFIIDIKYLISDTCINPLRI